MNARSGSLAGQLSRRLVLTLGIAWLVAAGGTATFVRHVMNQRLDGALASSAQRLLDVIAHEVAEQGGAQRAQSGEQMTPLSGANGVAVDAQGIMLVYQVVNAHGSILLRSGGAPSVPVALTATNGFSQSSDWRVYTLRHADLPIAIHTAESLQGRSELLRALTLGLLLPLLGLLPPAAFLIHRVTRRALAPVVRLADEIGQRGGTDLEPVGAGFLPVELQVIASSTNHLLSRLSHALDTERQRSTNAAHELRTPLATARLRLQSALDQCPPGPAAAQIAQAIASLDRLSSRAEKLLQRSHAEAGAALNVGPVDLGALAAAVVQDFWADPLVRARLQLSIESDEPILALGDFDSLGIALRNLIENAVRHADGERISVLVQRPAVIVVRDAGPGVPGDLLAGLVGRHAKQSAHPASYGLGLSIVSAIADRHHAKLTVKSPPAGQSHGFEARIELLPTAPP